MSIGSKGDEHLQRFGSFETLGKRQWRMAGENSPSIMLLILTLS